ncbi:Dam family site-specific DNA-(adenine-N6)-methyltransferase [Deinococcus depolymerans]|uniref:Site-specific DNA-methyltransferase (adenine-specific) n=1 Tax=Deinococcus depolymerans TaxID=392408 RepID=A0ABN1CDH8_9DEIO
MITPFLKWPGGKGWLYKQHPELFDGDYSNYFEPFLGSGAVFFSKKPAFSHLNDSNKELIETYRAIRDNHEGILDLLERHQKKHSKEYYYNIRSSRPTKRIEIAARMIYLNRTCWNGLYRVNLEGQFNVPIGTKTNVLMRAEDFPIISEYLKNTKLTSIDFSHSIRNAKEGDLIFADPPYFDSSSADKFKKYSSLPFTFNDHKRLARSLFRASERGAKVIMTHSQSDDVLGLYENKSRILYTDRRDTLSAKSEYRGRYREVVIVIGI